MYEGLRSHLPVWLHRYVMHFEAAIEDSVRKFADSLPPGSRVLDAGAGESVHAPYFGRHRYTGVDLGIGDSAWNYGDLDAVADLNSLPFRDGCFDASMNVVTLEHVREPACVLAEILRVLRPGGELLLIVPHEWEVHQSPYDYYRYTRYGLEYLLEKAGFASWEIQPAGGFFRLLSRRLLNGLQFFRGIWFIPAVAFLAPPALVLPLFDSLDWQQNFTLGYICIARKRR